MSPVHPMLLWTTTGGGWKPTIGDPTIMGWLTVVAYIVAAHLCFRAFRATREMEGSKVQATPLKTLWLALTFLLAFLAINKQLDLQSLFTHVGRELAHAQGWYARRREVQKAFIYTIGVGALIASLVLVWLARGPLARGRLALFGICVLSGFIVIRAASFHRVDLLLGAKILGVKMNWLFELGGIALIAFSAYKNGGRFLGPGRRKSPSVVP